MFAAAMTDDELPGALSATAGARPLEVATFASGGDPGVDWDAMTGAEPGAMLTGTGGDPGGPATAATGAAPGGPSTSTTGEELRACAVPGAPATRDDDSASPSARKWA